MKQKLLIKHKYLKKVKKYILFKYESQMKMVLLISMIINNLMNMMMKMMYYNNKIIINRVLFMNIYKVT